MRRLISFWSCALLIVILLCPVLTLAAETIEPAIESYSEEPSLTILDSGTCGESVYWYVDSAYVLHIYGSGEMNDFGANESPWFSYRSRIVDVVIDEGVSSIGNHSFQSFGSQVESFEMPSSIARIGDDAFYNCAFTKEVWSQIVLPDGLLIIGSWAFASCDNLISITIPSTVLSVGGLAFSSCTALETVNILAVDPPQGGGNMFNSCPITLKIYVPAGSVTAYETTQYWSDWAAFIVGGAVAGDGAGSSGGSSDGGITDGDDTFLAISVEHERRDFYYLNTDVQFYAEYHTVNWPVFDQSVTWTVNGNSPATTIDKNGLLHIASDENKSYLYVTATSVAYPGLSGMASIRLTLTTEPEQGEVPDETISPAEREEFGKLQTAIDEVKDTLSGSEEDAQAATEFNQIVDDKTDEFNEGMDVLGGMTEPNYKDIDAEFDNVFGSEGITLATKAIGTFFENEYIFQVFFIAFMLGLVSFVVFGKR